jgi:membrane-bound lytic murein transglycosylase F
LGGGQLSKYDAIFKKEASKYGWDWRFIASVAYQESKFNPDVVSFGGAYGMMQFMPGTGPKYGVYPNSTPAVQIAGGMKKLQSDFKTWHDIPETDQRQKFTLATYNAGLGHIKDAQRLAEKHGLNPTIWDGNVEEMVKKLSQKEFKNYESAAQAAENIGRGDVAQWIRNNPLELDSWIDAYATPLLDEEDE